MGIHKENKMKHIFLAASIVQCFCNRSSGPGLHCTSSQYSWDFL